jgi:hypothetical protein
MVDSLSPLALPRRVLVVQPQSLLLPFLCDIAKSSGASSVVGHSAFDPGAIRAFNPNVVMVDLDWLTTSPSHAVQILRLAAPQARIIGQSAFLSTRMLRDAGVDVALAPNADETDLRAELWNLLFGTDRHKIAHA